ncbi:hypothetical protein J1605_015829 [Eschrichtius robustus]|uniref:Uncharacterized protein n=1 Tax=Eschrichtius robustus TaxID=9764 RepID=A0AB34G8J8_ESCRO|nr:hypothetical protein J1605_015829 [Eschrichtius robustus]
MHADRNEAMDGPELVSEPCTTAPPPQVEEERGKGWREGTWWPCLRILCISRDSRPGCQERRCRLWPPGGVPGPSQRERRRGLRNEGGDAAEQGGNGGAVRGLLEAITPASFLGSTCVLCQGLGKWGLLCGVSSDWVRATSPCYRSLSPAGKRVLVQGEVSPSELKAIEGSCACC